VAGKPRENKKEIIIYLFINTVAFIPESKAFFKSLKKNGRFSDSFHVIAAFPSARGEQWL
jgi:hypothetical protein